MGTGSSLGIACDHLIHTAAGALSPQFPLSPYFIAILYVSVTPQLLLPLPNQRFPHRLWEVGSYFYYRLT